MVDNFDSHSIEFLGDKANKPASKKLQSSLNDVFDFKTQNTFFNIFGNYHKFFNNMMMTCSNICIKDFNHMNLNMNEEICLSNCQKKFFTTYAVGENYLKTVATKSKNADIFSDITHIDLIENKIDQAVKNI